MKLTCICPGIRTANWRKLYNSIGQSCTKYDWEIIFVGPYPLPDNMKGLPNANYIEDWGSPIRCQQIGLLAAQGDYITWAADDGVFLPKAIDIGFSLINEQGRTFNPKIVLMGKYTEGDGDTKHMRGNEYYMLARHSASKILSIPNNYYMLNVGLVSRQLLLEVGGWDCQFEVCPMAYNDLAIRLQNMGCQFIIQNELMFQCGHMPGHEGDHGPVHDGQVEHDEPLFKELYGMRKSVRLDNWKNAPERWERRFGTKPTQGS